MIQIKTETTEPPQTPPSLVEAIKNEDVSAVLNIFKHNTLLNNDQLYRQLLKGITYLIQYCNLNDSTLRLLRITLEFDINHYALRGIRGSLSMRPVIFIAIKHDKKEFFGEILKYPQIDVNFSYSSEYRVNDDRYWSDTPLSYAAFYDRDEMFGEILSRIDPWSTINICTVLCQKIDKKYQYQFLKFLAKHILNDLEKARKLFQETPSVLEQLAANHKIFLDFILDDILPHLQSSYEEKQEYQKILLRISQSEKECSTQQDPFYLIFAEARKQASTLTARLYAFFVGADLDPLDIIKAKVESSMIANKSI